MDVSSQARTHISQHVFIRPEHIHTYTSTQVAGLTPGEMPAYPSVSTRVEPFPGELTQFEQPAFSVRVEESVCEVVAIVLWDLERLVLDALIQVLE